MTRVRLACRALLVAGSLVGGAASLSAQPTRPADAYAGYVPGACISAAHRIDAYLDRADPDTARPDYAGAAVPDSVRLEAKRCTARFDIASAPPRELVRLAAALLAAGDDAAAERAIARRLASEARDSLTTRAATLAEVIRVQLAARPHRVATARAYLARLDALTDSMAVIGRLAGHAALLGHHDRAGEDSAAAHEAEQVLALAGRLDAHDRLEFSWALRDAHAALVLQAAERGPVPVRAALVRARRDLGALGSEGQYVTMWDSVYGMIGRPAPSIAAARWLGGEGAATKRPRAGRTTLIIFNAGRSTVPLARRLLAAVPELDLVLAGTTAGHFRGAGPLKPDAELDSLAKWYSEEIRAPGTVALMTPDFVRLADGRLPRTPTVTEVAYQVPSQLSAAIVDRQGVVRYTFFMRHDELRIERLLRALR